MAPQKQRKLVINYSKKIKFYDILTCGNIFHSTAKYVQGIN